MEVIGKEWNKLVFGDVRLQKSEVLNRIKELDRMKEGR